MTRAEIITWLGELLSFGSVRASKQATQTKQVLVTVRGNSDGENHEERPFQALWGHAGILFRPPQDTEVIFLRIGDEMVPIASRELRWGITLAEGEVVLRNLVSDATKQAHLHIKQDGNVELRGGAGKAQALLKPDGEIELSANAGAAKIVIKANGECVVDAATIFLGDAGATEKIALGTTLKSYLTTLRTELESLRSTFNAHVHTYLLATGPGVTGSTATPSTAPTSTVGAFTSPPDIESRHNVEN